MELDELIHDFRCSSDAVFMALPVKKLHGVLAHFRNMRSLQIELKAFFSAQQKNSPKAADSQSEAVRTVSP